MLNDQDILKLKSVFATKDDFKEMKSDIFELKGDVGFIRNNIQEMKSDMADLKELVQGLIISSDSIAKSIGDLTLEYAAIKHQINRHEEWIKQIAEKVGLKLVAD